MTGLAHDFRLAFRGLARTPGFAAVAVLTLALGIGANTAIFSVIDAVLLERPPYPEPERLAMVRAMTSAGGAGNFSAATFLDFARDSRSFERLAGYDTVDFSLTGEGAPELIESVSVSPGFFATLGVAPALGTGLETASDDDPVVLVTDGFWHRRFDADPAAVGRTLLLDGVSYRIAGVLPAEFRFVPAGEAEIWARGPHGAPGAPVEPEEGQTLEDMRGLHYFQVLGRLAPGVTIERAAEEASALARRYAEAYPDDEAGRGFRLVPLREELVGEVRPALLLLLGAVTGVLLIACGNVTGLLLARSVTRSRELAVRASLGAGSGRLVRQALVEGLLLALGGGAIGLLLGAWWVEALLALAPAGVTGLGAVALDGRVLAFTFALSLASVLVFSLVPALRASRPDLRAALLEGGARGGTGAGASRLRALVVVGETALALMLLIGAGLLARSLWELSRVDPGFEPDGVLAMTLSLPDASYPDDARLVAFWDELVARVGGLPGVEHAGMVFTLPFSGSAAHLDFTIEGAPAPTPGEEPNAGFQAVSGDYFRVMGIPLVRGRRLEPADNAENAPAVALVSEAFGRRFFPGADPLGRRINLGDPAQDDPWITVVGVVGDVRHRSLDRPVRAEVYLPHRQFTWGFASLVARSDGDPAALVAALRRELAAVDPDLPVVRLKPLADYIAGSIAERRFLTVLLGLFAALASVLAALGLYGVIAYGVVQRRREIGIRMALGARRAGVLRSVIGVGLAHAGAGIALGAAGAFALRRLLAGQLFGVAAADPATYVGVALLLAAVAALASWLPARRAAAVDPAITLRAE